MPDRRFNKTRIRRALDALAGELAARGIRAELCMVGGTAIALAYSARRSTKDIDAIFEPKAQVYDAAHVVAEQLGLPDDWLNDAMQAYLPGEDHARKVVFQRPSLVVMAASARYLLAMKVMAARVDQDADDIRFLYAECGFTTPEEGMDLLERCYPDRSFEPRTQFLLEELLGPMKREHEGPNLEELAVGGDAYRPRPRGPAPPASVRLGHNPSTACGAWMPVAQAHCVLLVGHGGRHRSVR